MISLWFEIITIINNNIISNSFRQLYVENLNFLFHIFSKCKYL